MTDPQNYGPTLAELARRMQEMYTRFEAIAVKMETSYVTKELYELNNKYVEELFKNSKEYSNSLRQQSQDDLTALQAQVTELQDDKTWLVRLVLGAILLAILGFALAGSKAISP